MLLSLLLGAALVIATTFVHAATMAGLLKRFKRAEPPRNRWESNTGRASTVALVVLVMFLVSLVEAGMWAAMYLALGAFPTVEKAVYFSAVTYTTLGFGDVVIQESWRLLSALEAANGIIMFGWTTAVIIATVERVYFPGSPKEPGPREGK